MASKSNGNGDRDQCRKSDSPPKWAQVVKGNTSESLITQEEDNHSVTNANNVNAADSSSSNAAAVVAVTTAWNMPSNGVVDEGSNSNSGAAVMGAESWPDLVESTKASPRLTSSASADSSQSRAFPNANGSASNSSQRHGSSSSYGRGIASQSHTASVPSARPRVRRGGGGVGGNGGGGRGNYGIGAVPGSFNYNHGPPPPPPPPLHTNGHQFVPYRPPANSYRFVAPPPPPPPQFGGGYRGPRPMGGMPSQGMGMGRGSNKKGNFGSHPHGEMPFYNNHGSSSHDYANGVVRDIHGMTKRGPQPPRGYLMGPPHPALFIPPPPHVGHFGNPMGYNEFPYYPTGPMDPYRGMPMVSQQAPAVMRPGPEPLSTSLIRQIEYYFSDENLIKDNYLRSHMDAHGWVPVSLIAGFPRVRKLMEEINQNTNSIDNIQFISDCLRPSFTVEVQDSRLRRRNEWMRWVNPSNGRSSGSGLNSSKESNVSMLGRSLENMSVGEASTSQDSTTVNPDTHSEAPAVGRITRSSGHSSLPNGEHTEDAAPSSD